MSQGSAKLGQNAFKSSLNTTTTPLNAGVTYTGTGELNDYPSVFVSCKTDQNGTIYIDFSNDGTNWDVFPSTGKPVTAGIHKPIVAVKAGRYCRVRLTNTSASNQTYLRLYTYYGSFSQLNSPLNTSLSQDADAIVTRSVLTGETDGGQYINVPVTNEGHLEVAIHDPILPFGAIHTESLTPIFQTDAVYGVNSGQVSAVTSGSGGATASDSAFVCSTGTTIYSQGVLLGRKRLRYRAGQGVVGRFTALFTAPVANSYQLVGVGHAEDGCYVGYGDTNDLTNTAFGILYVNRGVREVKTLTVSTGATSASNATITLNGTAFPVALTAASNIQRTVWEISQGTYAGWDAYPATSTTVIFVRKSAGTTAGTQSFSTGTTGAAATIAQTVAGVASTDLFIKQSDFNGDKLDGTGASGVTLVPTNLNIFQVGIGYLGTDSIVWKIKASPTDGNNSTWIVFHTIRLTNSRTTSIFGNPAFPFTMAAYSAGSTTNLRVKCASFAGFIEGAKMLHGNRFTYFNQLTTVGATNFQALFTIMNSRYYAGRTNQAVINLLNASGAIKHTSPVIYYLIRGGALGGNPSFQQLSANSCSVYDTAATTVTYSTGDQLLAVFSVGDTGEFDHHFSDGGMNMEELTLQPGEWITLAAKATTGTPSYVTGCINTREDQ